MLSYLITYPTQMDQLKFQEAEEVGLLYLAKKAVRATLYTAATPFAVIEALVANAFLFLTAPFHALFPENPLVDRMCYLAGSYLKNVLEAAGLIVQAAGGETLCKRGEDFTTSRRPFFDFSCLTSQPENKPIEEAGVSHLP